MMDSPFERMERMERTGLWRKAILVLAGALFLSVVLSSLFFIAHQENHDCIGEDCPVCASIRLAVQVVKQAIAKMMTVFSIIATLTLPILYMSFATDEAASPTPVGDKVRIND